ncbi:MAG TPA: hypothetical protein VGM90_17640 [Kofleriaceae bacterium]|jgi:hypothetical protein
MAEMRLSLALVLTLAACGSNKVPHDLDMEQPAPQTATKPPPLTPVQASREPVVTPMREPSFVYKVSLFVRTAVPAGTDPDSQIAIAVKENEDGIMSMEESNASEASEQFRDAVARSPNAVYYLNLCLSLYAEGKFSEGLASCDEVLKAHPPAGLRKIASGMHDRILWDAKQQGLTIQPAN